MKPHTWSCSWYFKVEQLLCSFYSVFHYTSSFSSINACILNDGPSFTTDVPKPDIIHFILYFHFNWTFALFHPICTLRVCNWAASLLGVDIIRITNWFVKCSIKNFNIWLTISLYASISSSLLKRIQLLSFSRHYELNCRI